MAKKRKRTKVMNRQFKGKVVPNKTNLDRVMVQCSSLIDKEAVSRQIIDGVEHVIISSFTLPDDIVMNGGLYPAEEIADSFQSLERTLAPVEHPTDNEGNFISANDPTAIHNFHAGAFNMNVEKDGDRIHIDKFINVQEAGKTDRGRRLLDRIEEIETNDKARPVHTSVGVFLSVEFLGEVRTNAAGLEYDWIARDMVFDHDAILLDNIGAAQPSQGVGLAVNADGEECDVQYHLLANDKKEAPKTESLEVLLVSEDVLTLITDALGDKYDIQASQEDEALTLVDKTIEVNRVVTFTPKTNESEGDAMKDVIVNALKEAGIEVEGLDETALLAQYNALQANQSSDNNSEEDDRADIADVVANALKPVADELAGLKAKLNSNDEAELNKLAEIVGNSDKYPSLDAESAKKLGAETLKGMAANCQTSFGIPGMKINDGEDKTFSAETTMPE